MQPANVDPVKCARLIVHAYASKTPDEPGAARSTPSDMSTPPDDLRQLAGVSAQPFFPPDVTLTLVCVLSSVAVVAWSIATQ
jgi:hypothetical protein